MIHTILQMLKQTALVFFALALLLSGGTIDFVFAGPADPSLQAEIDAKNQELEQINKEIVDTQSKLQETQAQRQTLSSEVSRIKSNISQINLGIKSSEVAVDKLTLEIRSLQGDIGNAEVDISQKQIAVGELLRQIQQEDSDGMLFVLLKNNTLSDSLFEMQALRDLYSSLLVHIEELNTSKTHLENVLVSASTKKQDKTTEQINLQNRKVISENLKKDQETFLAEVKNKEQAYNDYVDELTARQIAIAQEIADIEARLTEKIDFKNLPEKLPGLLQTPISKGLYIITQGYGATAFARKMYASGFHNGVDLGAPVGTPIYASEDGVVLAATNQDKYCYKGAYGRFVAIKHYMGLTTLYAHMSLFVVKQGDSVKRGDLIGYVGNSGLATGAHLHFGLYDSETFYIGPSKSCGPQMPFGGHINPYNYTIF